MSIICLKQRKIFSCFSLLIFLFVLSSCKKDEKRTETEKIINEWIGKQIIFPFDFQCNSLDKDTIGCEKLLTSEYKILLYIDSAGCTSCKLRLSGWTFLIEETDTLFSSGKLSFLFFFHPKNEKELQFIFLRDNFKYPIFIDKKNKINVFNHFPDKPEFQCFLLDRDNKVLLIGNPVLNPKIWELYKQTITGKTNPDTQAATSVSVEPEEVEIRDLSIGKKSRATFKIKNTGTEPFVIHRVNASCGCTVPVWEKQPVEPGKETEIRLEIQPEETGVFRKTVQVYGNVKEGVIRVTVKGTVKQ